MTTPIQLTAEHARRFLVRRHLLAPPRSLAAEPASVLAVMDRIGSLQFDPIEVPGARNHDLVLHARIAGYRREWCDHWLYGPERRLIEMYNKMLSIVPIAELPHYALQWTNSAEHYNGRILTEEAAVAEAILERIRVDGPLSTADFKEHAHSIDWWWAPTRAARAVLEALFVTGRVGIARRQGSRRFYDLIERLVPGDLLAQREPEDVANRHRLLSRFRAIGLMAATGQAELFYATGETADRARRIAELVDDGTLVPAEVEGQRATRYLLAAELPILAGRRARADAAGGHVPRAARPARLGSAPHANAVRVRLHLGDLHARGEAAPRVLRAADPLSATGSSAGSSRAASGRTRICRSSASGSRMASDRWRSRPSSRRWRTRSRRTAHSSAAIG